MSRCSAPSLGRLRTTGGFWRCANWKSAQTRGLSGTLPPDFLREEAWRLSRCSSRWRDTAGRSRPAIFQHRFERGVSLAVAASRISHEALANEATEIWVVDADLQAKCQQILTDPVSLEIVRTIALDVLVWHRLRGGWSSTFTDDVERAVTEAWGDSGLIRDVLRAASGDLVEQIPSAEVALAARLASDADMRGDPQARFDRDLLLVSHAGSSLCRRVLEPVIVDEILRGWSAVLANEGFALRSPSLHRPAIAHAIDEARSTGLKGAARQPVSSLTDFEKVIGLDVSPGHLRIAEELLRSSNANNVNLRLLSNLQDIQSFLEPYDFFYSIIVLQHNPPPVIKRILELALARLERGGAFLFQFEPTPWVILLI